MRAQLTVSVAGTHALPCSTCTRATARPRSSQRCTPSRSSPRSSSSCRRSIRLLCSMQHATDDIQHTPCMHDCNMHATYNMRPPVLTRVSRSEHASHRRAGAVPIPLRDCSESDRTLYWFAQSPSHAVLISAVPAIAAVAAAAGQQFTPYYSAFMPGFKQLLRCATSKEQRMLRAKVRPSASSHYGRAAQFALRAHSGV